MVARLVNRKRLGIRGRTDLGVPAGKTGVYETETTEVDRNGNVTARRRHTVYRLRRITDGFLVDREVGQIGEGGAPDSKRQSLEHLIGKTVVVEVGGREVALPFVFLDEPADPKYARVGRFPVPVADGTVREVMHDLCKARDKRIAGTQREWGKRVEVAEVEEAKAKAAVAKRSGKKAKKADEVSP